MNSQEDSHCCILANTPQLVAHSVATYAVSFKGFPKRTGVKVNAVTESSPYHGPKLFI
jgi:aminopeptidase Y